MGQVTLSATPKGNGFQATVTYPNGVSMSSSEAFPTQAEAIEAAALKVLDKPERLTDLDRSDNPRLKLATRRPVPAERCRNSLRAKRKEEALTDFLPNRRIRIHR